MTKDTDAFRKNRVLTTLESLAVRLEVVVVYLERKAAVLEEAPPSEGDPMYTLSEADKKQEEALTEQMNQRFWEAEQLAERVNSGKVSPEEHEAYMNRWKNGPG